MIRKKVNHTLCWVVGCQEKWIIKMEYTLHTRFKNSLSFGTRFRWCGKHAAEHWAGEDAKIREFITCEPARRLAVGRR